ncbi:hypothetical protein M514_27575, partial [Trichuris suis]
QILHFLFNPEEEASQFLFTVSNQGDGVHTLSSQQSLRGLCLVLEGPADQKDANRILLGIANANVANMYKTISLMILLAAAKQTPYQRTDEHVVRKFTENSVRSFQDALAVDDVLCGGVYSVVCIYGPLTVPVGEVSSVWCSNEGLFDPAQAELALPGDYYGHEIE